MTDESDAVFVPPWREIVDGKLSEEYGPKTPATYAKHLADFRNWAYRPAKERTRPDAALLARWIHKPDGTYRDGLSERELECYQYVYEQGHAIRWVARKLSIKRESVKCYLKRLRAKAKQVT